MLDDIEKLLIIFIPLLSFVIYFIRDILIKLLNYKKDLETLKDRFDKFEDRQSKDNQYIIEKIDHLTDILLKN